MGHVLPPQDQNLPCTLSPYWLRRVLLQAQKYAALRKPYLINDMVMQDVLLDRRRVYGSLQVNMPSAFGNLMSLYTASKAHERTHVLYCNYWMQVVHSASGLTGMQNGNSDL